MSTLRGSSRAVWRRVPHRRLSEPFDVLTLDLQSRLDAAAAVNAALSAETCTEKQNDVDFVTSGSPSGQNGTGAAGRQHRRPSAGASSAGGSAWEHEALVGVAATADGLCNAVLVWFEADLGGGHRLSSWRACDSCGSEGGDAGSNGGRRCACSDAPCGQAWDAKSWSQGLQYLDGVRANKAGAVSPPCA